MIKYKVSYTVSATISGEHTLYSTGAEDVQHTFDSIADLNPDMLVGDRHMRQLVMDGRAGIEFVVDLIEEVSDDV